MRKTAAGAQILLISLVWFLVLPFPFQSGWAFLGGYRIVRPWFPNGAEFGHEIDLSRSFYGSHLYIFLLVVVSAALGTMSFLAIRRLSRTSRT